MTELHKVMKKYLEINNCYPCNTFWEKQIREAIESDEKSSQLEPPVSQENGGRECPLCGGKNKKEFGGNDKCFHCENETCGFVQCEQSADDVIYMVSKRIKKFYKG